MSATRLRGERVRAYGEAILRWRLAVIALTVVAVLVCGFGLRYITFNPDSRVYFGPDDPGRQALDQLENTYSRATSLLFALAPHDGDVFTPDALKAVATLTERAWQIPYSSRVNSLTNYQHSWAEGDELFVEDLVGDVSSLDAAELERIRWTALAQPELVDLMISPDARVTAVNVDIIKPGQDHDEVTTTAAYARALADEIRAAHPDIDVYLTGGVMADVTFAEAAQRDMATLVPASAGLIAVALAIGLGSVLSALVTLVIVLISVAIALGVAGWAGMELNSATVGAPIVIMTLSIANCVHIIASVRRHVDDEGGRPAAILESLRVNASPITMCSLTTVVGFLTLNFSESPPLREFGNVVALGMVVEYLLAITFLPALLAYVPVGRPGRVFDLAAAMRRFADFVITHRRLLLMANFVTVIVFAGGLTRLYVDDDFVRYFDERFAFRTDSDFVQRNLVGLNALNFSLSSGSDQGIADPAYLTKLDAFAEWYRGQPNVKHVTSLSDTLKRLNMNMHGDDPSEYRLPDSRELAAQYLLFYEMSLPFGQDLNNRIDVARKATRVSVFLDEASSAEVREIAAAGEAWLAQNAPEIASPATGLSIVYANMSTRNIRSMLFGTVLELIVISGLMLIVLRSVRIGLISLAPNVVPALMAIGLWGYLGGEVNLAVSVVYAMTLGIIVDDTIHLLSHYLRARREQGMEAEAAVHHAVSSVGVPVIITSVALVIGFGVMALSGFAVSSLMGLLCALTIGFALGTELLFLGPILLAFERRRA
jgi:predicted RND superfamily exporter protein